MLEKVFFSSKVVPFMKVEKYCRAEQAIDDNMARVLCMLDKLKLQIHTQNTLFHCKNGCPEAIQYYVVRIFPVVFGMSV